MNSQGNQRKVAAELFRATGIVLASGVMALSLLISAPAGAQVVGATLSGTLSDPSGAVIPKAQVVIKNVATGISSTITTNASGFYTVSNLLPGNYEMTATEPGFSTEERTGITLEVGAQVVENITLKVGQATQKVEVTAAAPEIQLASSTIGAVVGSTAIVELPLNGRSWTDLTLLQPGTVGLSQTQTVFDSTADATTRTGRALGNQVSIDGGRPTMNNYRLDGISIDDYGNGAPSNMSGGLSGVDAIQEFSVLTNNYSAEYGNTAGGVINAITRSGTNQFHGTAYEFLRNDVFDARNYFDGPTIPPFRRNQFGASIGGPIRTDHTFFFANYEGTRQLLGVTSVNVVPSAAARAGNICSAPSTPTACTPSTVTVNAAAAAFLPFYPLPNAGLITAGNGDTGTFDFAGSQLTSENLFTTRIDQTFSDKDSLAGTYLISHSPFTTPDNLDDIIYGYLDDVQVIALEETHIINSRLVNTARVGALRQYATASQFVSAINPLVTDTSLGTEPGLDAAQLKITGISSFTGGADAQAFHRRGVTNIQLYDDASWVRGTHTIKFGFAGDQQVFDDSQIVSAGNWSFGTLTNFLTNNPSAVTGPTVYTVPPYRSVRDTVLGGYVQDDWRVRPNLTLNLGFRYEMLTNPTEIHGWESSLTSLTATAPRLGNPFFLTNPTTHDFEPRVGFAWDPFHNGKTSVRSGFGMFDVLPMTYIWQHQEFLQSPYASSSSATNTTKTPLAGKFYNGATQYLTPASAQVSFIEPNPHRIYVMQWNLSVQRELAPTLTATVSYAGSTGVHQIVYANGDTVLPTLTSAGYLYPNPVRSGTLLNPNFGNISMEYFGGHSSYDALLVMVQKRMSHGFQIQGSYTWGKSLDGTSSSLGNNDFNNSINDPDYFAPKLIRGPSDFNVSQTLAVNAIWQIPETKSLSGFAGRAVNGWQLAAIYQANSGIPFSPTYGTSGNPAGNNYSANAGGYPDRLSNSGACHSAIHKGNPNNYINLSCFSLPTAPNMAYWTANCDTTSKIYGSPATTAPYPICFNLRGDAARNSMVGPGVSNLNLSVFKNNKIGERFNAQFRAEFFNILNRTNFDEPVSTTYTDIYGTTGVPSATAGELTETSTTSRQIQFALKLIW